MPKAAKGGSKASRSSPYGDPTRPENQERAFVAASRRTDRSLDDRFESAKRASDLHKKRTGKALNITKEIVQSEAMYEEVDERMQARRIQKILEDERARDRLWNQHLLAMLATQSSNSPAGQSQPEPPVTGNVQFPTAARSMSTPDVGFSQPQPASSRVCMDGVRSMSLDLSSLHLSTAGQVPLASPVVTTQDSMVSTGYNFFSSPQQNAPNPWYSQQMSPYAQQPWQPQWTGFQPEMQQHHHIVHDNALQLRTSLPIRNRFPSDPMTYAHGLPMVSPTSSVRQQSQSTPGPIESNTSAASQPDVQPSSVKAESPTYLSSPESYPSPETPISPKSTVVEPAPASVALPDPAPLPQPGLDLGVTAEKDDDYASAFIYSTLDPDWAEFSQFAGTLSAGSAKAVVPEQSASAYDDLFGLDELSATS